MQTLGCPAEVRPEHADLGSWLQRQVTVTRAELEWAQSCAAASKLLGSFSSPVQNVTYGSLWQWRAPCSMSLRIQWGFCYLVWDSSFDACSSVTTERAVFSHGPVAPALCHQLNGSY